MTGTIDFSEYEEFSKKPFGTNISKNVNVSAGAVINKPAHANDANAAKFTGHSEENFALSGAIGGYLQRGVPIYGLVNSHKKANALLKAGDKRYQDITPGARVGGKLLTDVTGVGIPLGAIENGVTGSRFQDLINKATNRYIKKHPDADRVKVRKSIKKALYSGKDKLGVLSDLDITNMLKTADD